MVYGAHMRIDGILHKEQCGDEQLAQVNLVNNPKQYVVRPKYISKKIEYK